MWPPISLLREWKRTCFRAFRPGMIGMPSTLGELGHSACFEHTDHLGRWPDKSWFALTNSAKCYQHLDTGDLHRKPGSLPLRPRLSGLLGGSVRAGLSQGFSAPTRPPSPAGTDARCPRPSCGCNRPRACSRFCVTTVRP